MSIMPIFHTRQRNYYEPFSGDTYPRDEYRHESAIATTHSHSHPHPHPHHHQQPRVLSPFSTKHHNHNHHPHANNGSLANSRVEWREGSDAYFIRTELPGIRREDVKITILEDEKLLKITGSRNTEYKEDTYDNWHHVEQSGGKFVTAFVLPENAAISADQVKATMENGVLNITLPKRMSKYHARPVEIVV